MMFRNLYLIAVLFSTTVLAQTQNALDFDGIDDRVDCGSDASVDITGTHITLEAWIYPTSWRAQVYEGTIISKDGGILSFAGYMLRAGGDGILDFAFGDGTAWRAVASPAAALTLNNWQHVAATYDGVNLRLYINGVSVATGTASTAIASTPSELVLGDWSTATGRNFPGIVDEVRIWNVALGQGTLATMQLGSYCGDEPGLRAYYKFDQGVAGGDNSSITTLTDATGSNDGILSGFALVGNTSNFLGGMMLGNQVSDVLCPDEVYLFGGQNITEAGVYTATFPTGGSCDSTVVLTLTEATVNTNIVQNGNQLIAAAAGTYQWVDCDNGFSIIPGATGQYYTATVNGDYAVIVTQGGCADTSVCLNVTGIGMDEIGGASLRVQEGVVRDALWIEVVGTSAMLSVEVLDPTGRLVFARTIPGAGRQSLDVTGLTSGMHFLRVTSAGRQRVFRFVKE